MAVADTVIEVLAERISDVMALQRRKGLILVRCEEILDLEDQMKGIRGVLDDAERRRFTDARVDFWLDRLEEALYQIDDLLDDWSLALIQPQKEQSDGGGVAAEKNPFSCIPSSLWLFPKKVVTGRNFALEICKSREKLDRLNQKYLIEIRMLQSAHSFEASGLLSVSVVNVENIHGREVDREILVRKLMVGSPGEADSGVQVIPVVGLAGIGKTTLAQLVYNDNRVQDYYQLRIWACVSRCFDLISTAKIIVQSVQGTSPNREQLRMPLNLLKCLILGMKFLLVLDDVRVEDHASWEVLKQCLSCGGKGSAVLVTTRNGRVARMMSAGEMYHLGQLSDEACWLILSSIALVGRSGDELRKLRDIGMEIATKCNGMPLIAKVLGRLLRFKNSVKDWVTVMESEMWELEVATEGIFRPLLETYNEFSPVLKCCLSYFGIIPKGSEVHADKLIRCWSALGYLGLDRNVHALEIIGQGYLNNLGMQCLFQDSVQDEFEHIIMCKMHGIVHDLAQFLRKNTSNGRFEATCQDCGTSLGFYVKKYRSLVFQNNPPPYICDCLKSLRVLSLRECGLEGIPRDMIKLIHLRFLDLSYNKGLCVEDLKTVSKLNNLQTLLLCFCGLQELPMELGNLSQLIHLNLSFNTCLKELPDSICNLLELRSLDLVGCDSLSELPKGIHRLRKLTHLHNLFTEHLCPNGVGQLTSLRTLNEFSGKLSLLTGLNQLSGSLQIRIPELRGLNNVVDAKRAKLYKKVEIQELEILFPLDHAIHADEGDESISMDVINALEPHPNLIYLEIKDYGGSKLPGWISSPINHVRQIELRQFMQLPSLPSLGELPCLEELTIQEMDGLQYVGREFLGLTTQTWDMDVVSSYPSRMAATNTIAFPKLKVLIFYECQDWEEWEDITAEEEESASFSIMPCLKKLDVVSCSSLTVLPHRLLRKAARSSLQELDIYDSAKLIQMYEDKEGSAWKSVSHITQVSFD